MSLDKKYRILICPHEIGGQMQLMAQELRRRGYNATSASYTQDWLGHVNDISIDLNNISGMRRQLRKFLFTIWAADQYDIFHFFWGSSLFGLRWFPHLDLGLLELLGKKIFVHFRGLDIVDLAYFDYLRSKTAGDPVTEPPISRPDQIRSLRLWRRYANRLLVSEPDLLLIVPEAEMVQQAIDLEHWKPSSAPVPKQPGDPIRILHAPTLRRKKGTEFVEKSVSDLRQQGCKVELVLVEKIPASQVKPLYESCDLAIDQVLYGWHGKFSAELMALGKPVVCYLDDELVKCRPDLPIVNANPSNLTEKLRELVENAQLRQDLAQRGQVYASKYHDVRSIVDECLRIYYEAF